MTRDTVVLSYLRLRFENKYVLTRRVVNVIIFLKKRVPIKADGFIGNPSYCQEISYSFGHQKHDLWVKYQTSDFPLYGGIRTMVGRMYVRAPVSSNIMTTTVTVMRITPLREQRRYR